MQRPRRLLKNIHNPCLTPNEPGLPQQLRDMSLTAELVTPDGVDRVAGSTVTRSRSAARAAVMTPHRLLVCLCRKESGLRGSRGCVSPALGSSEWSLPWSLALSFSLSGIVWVWSSFNTTND